VQDFTQPTAGEQQQPDRCRRVRPNDRAAVERNRSRPFSGYFSIPRAGLSPSATSPRLTAKLYMLPTTATIRFA